MKADVVIVGAGPSGLTASTHLAKTRNVVLIEQSLRYSKSCAGGITSKTLHFIPRHLIEKKFKTALVHTPYQTIKIESEKPFLYTISREALAEWQLKQALSVGVELIKAKALSLKNNVLITTDQKIKYNYLIGADGSTSIIRRSLNLKTENYAITVQYTLNNEYPNIEFFIDATRFGSGYAWIFPHDSYTIIGAGSFIKAKQLKTNLDKLIKRLNLKINSKPKFWPINFDFQGYNFNPIFLIGDAAGFASPLTGEGLYQAFISGIEIARKITNPSYGCNLIKDLLKTRKRHQQITKFLTISRYLTRIQHELITLLLRIKPIQKLAIKKLSY